MGFIEKLYKTKENVKPLDYSKVNNWLINNNFDYLKKYDLIYFFGTSVNTPKTEDGVGLDWDMMRNLGYMNYMKMGSQLSEDARVFCPIQRQMALEHALKYESHKTLLEEIVTKEPYVDLAAALDYYFEHYNKDAKRPFVLAGHSQGSASLQALLAKYFLDTEKRVYLKSMIAAYSLGYGVSKGWFNFLPNKEGLLHFVEGEDDYNCLISWNVEGPGEKGHSFLLADPGDETLLINPLNWKKDETYAGIEENKGVLVMVGKLPLPDGYVISNKKEDLCDAQIDLKRGSLICTTQNAYIKFPGHDEIWGGKSLHGFDGNGFYNNIKENLRLRVAHYLKAHQK